MKECIHNVVMEELEDKDYNSEMVTEWTKNIANKTKFKLKGASELYMRECYLCVYKIHRGLLHLTMELSKPKYSIYSVIYLYPLWYFL